MPPSNLRAAIEALLFSSDQPLTLALLAEALESPAGEVAESLQALGAEYADRGAGVELREMAGGWMVTTTAGQHEWVARMLRGRRRMRLSRAALETMAIVAYKQPVTKSEIEAIRGVDSSGTLATLLERNLVTIKGRSTVVGRPLLYGTTGEFLNYFGLRDLTELPRPEELRALVAAREPEQLEMLELDPDGLPLAAAARAGLVAAAPDVATDLPAASDAGAAGEGPGDEPDDDEPDDDEFDDDEDDDGEGDDGEGDDDEGDDAFEEEGDGDGAGDSAGAAGAAAELADPRRR